MNKFWIILAHTFITRVKTKSFFFTTFLTIVLIVAAGNFQSISNLFGGGGEGASVAVYDESGEVLGPLNQSLASIDADISLESFSGPPDRAEEQVQDGTFDGYLEILSNEETTIEAAYYSEQGNATNTTRTIAQALQPVKTELAAEQAEVDPAAAQAITSPVAFETIALEENAISEAERSSAAGLVYGILFLLYLSVIIYGNMLAMDVATEKSSRVMEILVSSASPVLQMFAKIFGIALLGLTQLLAILITVLVVIQTNQNETSLFHTFGWQDASFSIYVYAVIFFLLGYLLYATLAAMLGSIVSRSEDVNQLIAPMIYLIMIAFFIAIYGLSAPDSTIVTVTSFIPFFTPMLMFLRVSLLSIPAWEIGIAIALMVMAIVLLGIIGARVYRGGVLMYGKSNSLKDMKEAVQLSKKE
ncbi:ABC transporter permease [Alteribacillus sp. HJP-4]|uniref:ABC transporter permease n=1 Tax=Alteribacillus sp. HJP-4 TaxID=2775394 RepID=UPI0035CD095B